MPTIAIEAGRLVPASPLEFARYAKNLAWLLEIPLHIARDVLAVCYGFGTVHELMQAVPQPGEADRPTGPFDEPRARPLFFPTEAGEREDQENKLQPFSGRELKLLRICENLLYQRPETEGRLRRRHYAALDGAFFSAPSLHRKRFAELKSGILAMEGPSDDRERYLERNWPVAFWSYLEATHLSRFDALSGLDELKGTSRYFKDPDIMSMADMFHATAAHRAPAIFLAMAGEDAQALEGLPSYEDGYYTDLFDDLPSIGSGSVGLFWGDYSEDWFDFLDKALTNRAADSRCDALFSMEPHELAAAPPPGTPSEVVEVARRWRLHQLRALCRLYVESEYTDRHVARQEEMFWPGSPGNTVEEKTPFVLTISRNGPSLMCYSELSERSRSSAQENHCQFWQFKTLLTRTAPDEREDVVGYMAGWLVVLAGDKYACDQDELVEMTAYVDRMLSDGAEGFVRRFLPYVGVDSVLEFVNSRFHSSFAVTELVLRPKYRGQGLASLSLSALNSTHQNAPFTDRPDGWLEWADFELERDADIGDREPDVYITPPSVFLVPVERTNKRLRRYLTQMRPTSDLALDDEDLEVFPLVVDEPATDDGAS